LGHTNLKYFKIDNLNFDDKIYFSNASQVDKIFLRVHFVFEDLTSENNSRSLTDKKKFYWYESFKWPEKSSYNINSISLKCDEIKARKISINENLRRIVDKNFHKIDKCIQDFGRDKFLNQVKCDGNFDLFYFQKHLECLKTLQKFVKNFEYFKLVEDDFSGGTINMKTTMKISELKNFFKDKFKEDLEQESNNYDKLTSKTFKSFETLINDCFTNFVSYMLTSDIFLPISDYYSTNLYRKELYDCVYSVVKVKFFEYEMAELKEIYLVFEKIIVDIINCLKEKQRELIRNICRTDLFYNHFSQLLGKQIKTLDDFIIVEKIVCDFHNMLAYKINIGCSLSKSFILTYYRSPIFIDDYDCSIIRGIEIKLADGFLDKFGSIKAYDDKGKVVNFIASEHFFFGENRTLNTTSGILKQLNIKEIEVITEKKGKRIRFKVEDYLNS
jgi:hypothetical protein